METKRIKTETGYTYKGLEIKRFKRTARRAPWGVLKDGKILWADYLAEAEWIIDEVSK